MGYTHYWYYNPSKATATKNSAFSKATEEITKYKALLESRGLVVKGPLGEDEPEVNEQLVAFNGDGAQQLDHESFYVERDTQSPRNGFAFCKTARKPYDTLVCLALISLFEAFEDPSVFSYCSDGNEEDWSEAYGVYREVHDKEPPTLESAEPPED